MRGEAGGEHGFLVGREGAAVQAALDGADDGFSGHFLAFWAAA
jgi:hypothetical protein